MPSRSAEEKAERKLLLQQKKEARALQKQGAPKAPPTSTTAAATLSKAGLQPTDGVTSATASNEEAFVLMHLPEVALHHIMSFLSAQDLGCWTMTCQSFRNLLFEARVHYLLTRLHHQHQSSSSPQSSNPLRFDLMTKESQVHALLQQSLQGNTGRVVVVSKKRKAGPPTCDEFVSYARFVEESVCGYATIRAKPSRSSPPIRLPHFVHGRFASVSPEHSICRVGGDGQVCGAGGSGVGTWGVGKRGQLGHGLRQDVASPKRLLGGIGYGGVRIVQVSAGGGLVRVAHSLLLTSSGKVLSFGSGQYGALGHGYNAGKQLPDVLRPQYIQALAHLTCICVSAGELHSAVVTSDGDVYTWGDGFCGQLGQGDKRPRPLPKQVTCGGLEDECVTNISCGSRHTLAVTEDGECWSWGLGHFGVLGRSWTPFDYDADTAVESFQQQAPVVPGPEEGAEPAPDGAAESNADRHAAAIMDAAADYVIERRAANLAAAANAAQPDSQEQDRDEPPEAAAALIAHIANMAYIDGITNLSLDDSSTQCIPTIIDSLKGIKIIGASAGHRHSLVLDATGGLYSFGSGGTGCLGHGTTSSEVFPVRIMQFVDEKVQICQMSAGVDISMAVSTTGDAYAWGKTEGGRIGFQPSYGNILLPRKVQLGHHDDEGSKSSEAPIKAVDVECGYVHSIIVGLDGSLHMCGGVGVDGEADGQNEEIMDGLPRRIPDFNIWHRLPEPQLHVKTERWKKYGKYEVKGRSKMLSISN